ncbi:predicted protein [Arabidopsis lyrata subsp. lyrata]|uniref:Predicted protein n=1 Tax=Arabidopsis lyrata subsp. lyrata TaxID=81972 RepID=D7M5B0_ARALL|nr:predicted protein [Arabidopsis lyrata subsp. lyrata]
MAGSGVRGINLVFYSGSSYTYFNAEAYQEILDLVRNNFFSEKMEDLVSPVVFYYIFMTNLVSTYLL